MPFSDPVKKAAYYENHIKHCQKEYIAKNRGAWNDYQKTFKSKRRALVNGIKETVVELNISEKGTLCHKAAVIFFTSPTPVVLIPRLLLNIYGIRKQR